MTIRSMDQAREAGATPTAHRATRPPNLLDCPICGAPNGRHRAGCFNCGSLLQPAQEAGETPLVRLVVGEANRPGRVLYVRRWRSASDRA